MVAQADGGQVVTAGIGVFNITNATFGVLHGCCNTIIPTGTQTTGPANGCAGTVVFLPGGGRTSKIGGKHKSRARPVRTVHRRNSNFWQLNTGVQGHDLGIVPRGNGASINICQHVPAQGYRVWLNAGNVHNRHNAAHDGGELEQVVGFQLLCIHWCIGRTKIHRTSYNLVLTCTGPNALVVDRHARSGLGNSTPTFINRSGKAGTCTGHALGPRHCWKCRKEGCHNGQTHSRPD